MDILSTKHHGATTTYCTGGGGGPLKTLHAILFLIISMTELKKIKSGSRSTAGSNRTVNPEEEEEAETMRGRGQAPFSSPAMIHTHGQQQHHAIIAGTDSIFRMNNADVICPAERLISAAAMFGFMRNLPVRLFQHAVRPLSSAAKPESPLSSLPLLPAVHPPPPPQPPPPARYSWTPGSN